MGGESGGDQQAQGLGPGGHHHRQHQRAHAAEAGVPEGRTVAEALPAKPGHLHEHLGRPSQQKCPGQAPDAELPAKQQIVQDDDAVGGHAQGRGDIELPHGLEHAHHGKGHPGEEHRGKQDPQKGRAQRGGLRIKSVRQQRDDGSGQGHPQQGKQPGQQARPGEKAVGQPEGVLPAPLFHALGKHRDKTRGDGRGENGVKEGPGDPAGHLKGGALHARGEVVPQQHVPHQPQHLARQGDRHDQAHGFEPAALIRFALHGRLLSRR